MYLDPDSIAITTSTTTTTSPSTTAAGFRTVEQSTPVVDRRTTVESRIDKTEGTLITDSVTSQEFTYAITPQPESESTTVEVEEARTSEERRASNTLSVNTSPPIPNTSERLLTTGELAELSTLFTTEATRKISSQEVTSAISDSTTADDKISRVTLTTYQPSPEDQTTEAGSNLDSPVDKVSEVMKPQTQTRDGSTTDHQVAVTTPVQATTEKPVSRSATTDESLSSFRTTEELVTKGGRLSSTRIPSVVTASSKETHEPRTEGPESTTSKFVSSLQPTDMTTEESISKSSHSETAALTTPIASEARSTNPGHGTTQESTEPSIDKETSEELTSLAQESTPVNPVTDNISKILPSLTTSSPDGATKERLRTTESTLSPQFVTKTTDVLKQGTSQTTPSVEPKFPARTTEEAIDRSTKSDDTSTQQPVNPTTDEPRTFGKTTELYRQTTDTDFSTGPHATSDQSTQKTTLSMSKSLTTETESSQKSEILGQTTARSTLTHSATSEKTTQEPITEQSLSTGSAAVQNTEALSYPTVHVTTQKLELTESQEPRTIYSTITDPLVTRTWFTTDSTRELLTESIEEKLSTVDRRKITATEEPGQATTTKLEKTTTAQPLDTAELTSSTIEELVTQSSILTRSTTETGSRAHTTQEATSSLKEYSTVPAERATESTISQASGKRTTNPQIQTSEGVQPTDKISEQTTEDLTEKGSSGTTEMPHTTVERQGLSSEMTHRTTQVPFSVITGDLVTPEIAMTTSEIEGQITRGQTTVRPLATTGSQGETTPHRTTPEHLESVTEASFTKKTQSTLSPIGTPDQIQTTDQSSGALATDRFLKTTQETIDATTYAAEPSLATPDRSLSSTDQTNTPSSLVQTTDEKAVYKTTPESIELITDTLETTTISLKESSTAHRGTSDALNTSIDYKTTTESTEPSSDTTETQRATTVMPPDSSTKVASTTTETSQSIKVAYQTTAESIVSSLDTTEPQVETTIISLTATTDVKKVTMAPISQTTKESQETRFDYKTTTESTATSLATTEHLVSTTGELLATTDAEVVTKDPISQTTEERLQTRIAYETTTEPLVGTTATPLPTTPIGTGTAVPISQTTEEHRETRIAHEITTEPVVSSSDTIEPLARTTVELLTTTDAEVVTEELISQTTEERLQTRIAYETTTEPLVGTTATPLPTTPIGTGTAVPISQTTGEPLISTTDELLATTDAEVVTKEPISQTTEERLQTRIVYETTTESIVTSLGATEPLVSSTATPLPATSIGMSTAVPISQMTEEHRETRIEHDTTTEPVVSSSDTTDTLARTTVELLTTTDAEVVTEELISQTTEERLQTRIVYETTTESIVTSLRTTEPLVGFTATPLPATPVGTGTAVPISQTTGESRQTMIAYETTAESLVSSSDPTEALVVTTAIPLETTAVESAITEPISHTTKKIRHTRVGYETTTESFDSSSDTLTLLVETTAIPQETTGGGTVTKVPNSKTTEDTIYTPVSDKTTVETLEFTSNTTKSQIAVTPMATSVEPRLTEDTRGASAAYETTAESKKRDFDTTEPLAVTTGIVTGDNTTPKTRGTDETRAESSESSSDSTMPLERSTAAGTTQEALSLTTNERQVTNVGEGTTQETIDFVSPTKPSRLATTELVPDKSTFQRVTIDPLTLSTEEATRPATVTRHSMITESQTTQEPAGSRQKKGTTTEILESSTRGRATTSEIQPRSNYTVSASTTAAVEPSTEQSTSSIGAETMTGYSRYPTSAYVTTTAGATTEPVTTTAGTTREPVTTEEIPTTTKGITTTYQTEPITTAGVSFTHDYQTERVSHSYQHFSSVADLFLQLLIFQYPTCHGNVNH